jgi:hypothetical protein
VAGPRSWHLPALGTKMHPASSKMAAGPTRRQQRAPVPRAPSRPGAGPSCPRANQARGPPAGPRSTGGSERAAESATSGPDGLRPHRRIVGSETEAADLLIGRPGRDEKDPARKPETVRPVAGRLARGPSRLRCAAGSHGGSVDTQRGPLAPAAARPPRRGAPGPEAAPGPHGCPRPRHLLRPLAQDQLVWHTCVPIRNCSGTAPVSAP